MNVTVVLNMRYVADQHGQVWTKTGMDYRALTRYLSVFDSVTVLARSEILSSIPEGYLPVSGPHIAVEALPNFKGPLQYVQQYVRLRDTIKSHMQKSGAVILRIPSTVASLASSFCKSQMRPFGVEVVGDPYDLFAPECLRHPLRPFFRWKYTRDMRSDCRSAVAAAYVTSEALQRRYPARSRQWSYSSIDLANEAFRDPPFGQLCSEKSGTLQEAGGCSGSDQKVWKIITVGSLANNYKGVDVLLKALARCKSVGFGVMATVVGDGDKRSDLERLSHTLGIEPFVTFRGRLTAGKQVRDELDRHDIFVLASRQEGLPRAMIEAMARGLPCVGSRVGGIPELLDDSECFSTGDERSLAGVLARLFRSPARVSALQERNVEVARRFHIDLLRERRLEFYKFVKMQTHCWATAAKSER